jgi:hypothetical protein
MKYIAFVTALLLSGILTWKAYAQSASPSVNPSPSVSSAPSASVMVPSAAPRTGFGR